MAGTRPHSDSGSDRNDTTWFRKLTLLQRNPGGCRWVRLHFFGLVATLWLLVILVQLWDLQLVQAERFVEKAQRQQIGLIEVRATRGALYDRFGEELAVSTQVDSIGVFPNKIRNRQLTVTLLSKVLRLDPKVVSRKLRGKRFQWIKRLAEPGEAERVRNLNLPGIHFENESKRYYPKGEIASHLLGDVGVDHEGQAGLEQRFERLLRGESGERLVHYDALRNRYASQALKEPVPGASLVLTIDQKMQVMAEKELADAVQRTQAIAGTIIVMDAHQGDLLALANRPTFNPNKRARTRQDLERRRNYALSHLIEPGSIFKIVPMAAVIEENLASPDELVDCQMGAIYIGARRIRDHKRFGLLTVSEVLARSSNVGLIKLSFRLGAPSLYDYILRFEFGQKTGLPLPGEAAGLVRPLESWKGDSLASISIGQEIAVTSIQMARAVCAIANGGLLVRPRLVEAILYPDGRREGLEPAAAKRILSPKTTAILRAMMEKTVQEGSGQLARTPGYRVGGKTGTAQKVDPETSTYSRTDYVASFVGFAPVNDPSIVVVIVLDSPVGEYYGGEVAAPVFVPVATQALRFRDVPTELPLAPAKPVARPVADELLIDFVEELPVDGAQREQAGAEGDRGAEILVAVRRPPGSTRPRLQAEGPSSWSLAKEAALRVTDYVVPDFRGQTVRQVLAQSTALGLAVKLRGKGVAQQQWPLAGTPIPQGKTISVEFAGSLKGVAGEK